MTLSIDISPEVEARLRDSAARVGVDASEYARRLIEQNLASTGRPASLHELFAQWDAEDTTTDPTEIQVRQHEWEEFKKSVNENHSSDRVVYP